MNRLIYSLLLLLVSPLALLYFGYRAVKSSDYRGRIGERFGFGLPNVRQPILIHCASMGETLAALPLIKALQQRYPQSPILVTTTSPTGSAQVKQHLGDSVSHCYLPLDLNWVMKRFIAAIAPKAVILMETELWPNLIHHSHKRQIPVVLANARLSARSAKGYQCFHGLVEPMLQQLTAVAVQNGADGERFVELGLPAKGLTQCGSLKFDINIDDNEKQQALALRQEHWGDRPSWVAASTHPGEFEQVIEAHTRLLQQYPDLLLIIVPRHPEQFERAFALANKAQLTTQKRSSEEPIAATTQVLIGDTMGELKRLYGGSDIAFVGGSLIERGGHNPLEPAAFGKPILMGPHFFNFAQIGDALHQQGIMQIVADSDELVHQIELLLASPESRATIAAKALAFVEHNSGATQRQLAAIGRLLG